MDIDTIRVEIPSRHFLAKLSTCFFVSLLFIVGSTSCKTRLLSLPGDSSDAAMSLAVDMASAGRRDLASIDLALACTAPESLGFGPPSSYVVGSEPAIAIGDLNGDGRIDIVTANNTDRTVSVLLNDGGGGFADAATYDVSGNAWGVAAADLNGDGTLDLAVSVQHPSAGQPSAGTVSILLNRGNGTFGSPIEYPSGANTIGVAAKDLNGDGVIDLAVTNYAGNNVGVLLNTGQGVFGDVSFYSVGVEPYLLDIGDVNGDGLPDIVVGNQGDSTISVLMNRGKGLFSPSVAYPANPIISSVALADVNGDGKLDVATGSMIEGVDVFINSGNGTFAAPVTYRDSATPYVAFGDVNGDCKPDLVVANSVNNVASNDVTVLINAGNGTFGAGADFTSSVQASQIALGDLNGDGRLDIATANTAMNTGEGTVSVLLNTSH